MGAALKLARVSPAPIASPTSGGKSQRSGAPETGGSQAASTRIGYVLTDEERSRILTDYFDVPTVESGRGHYGVVRIGTDKEKKTKVAIKSVPKRRAVYVEMLRLEVEVLRRMAHVNVVRLFDAFEDEQEVHLVFESCTGGELFEPIANRQFRFSEFEAAVILRKILLAVKHMHDMDVVHRDLKPENILFSEPGIDSEVKVIDFGLATSAPLGTALKKHVGTPYYIAPEVIAKSYNRECDMWSIGVILFTLMCGYPPFWGDTEREIYGRVKRGHYAFEGPDWHIRSAAVKELVNSLLMMNASSRYSVDQALKHPWVVYEGQEAPSTTNKKLFTWLRRFTGFPLLKRVGLLVLARLLPDEDLIKQLEWFHSIDQTDCGYIRQQDLVVAALSRSMSMMDREAEALIREVGVLRGGVITFHEFVAATIPRTQYFEATNVTTVFNGLDADGDGIVSLRDLEALLGTNDDYAKAIMYDCGMEPDTGLQFADFFQIYCGSEYNYY